MLPIFMHVCNLMHVCVGGGGKEEGRTRMRDLFMDYDVWGV